jgi:N-acetylglucosaminyldiphosphoundecaprenol N-acetyl-beta-D-mannosaminyltransferase
MNATVQQASEPIVVDLLGLSLTTCRPEQAVEHVIELAGRGPVTVAFVNLHTANLSCDRPSYREVLNSADVLFNDGIGVEVGCLFLGRRLVSDLPGNVLVPALLQNWPRRPCRVFMVGSTEDVVQHAGTHVMNRFENVVVTGAHHGFFSLTQESQLVASINQSRSEILLVGMGNPRQEEFIVRNRAALHTPVAIAVGGLLDIWGGKLHHYPKWATRYRCHWLYRIKQAPGRMWRRYLVGGPRFFARLLYSRFSSPRDQGPSKANVGLRGERESM